MLRLTARRALTIGASVVALAAGALVLLGAQRGGTGTLEILFSPADAIIELDEGRRIPGATELPVGRHVVSVGRAGYGHEAFAVDIRAGRSETRFARLRATGDRAPAAGRAGVVIDAPGAVADVTLDGRKVSRLPMWIEVAPGPHAVSVAGKTPVRIEVRAESLATVYLGPQPDKVALSVVGRKGDAVVLEQGGTQRALGLVPLEALLDRASGAQLRIAGPDGRAIVVPLALGELVRLAVFLPAG